MSEEKKKIVATSPDAMTDLSSLGTSLSRMVKDLSVQSESFTALSKQIDAICGRNLIPDYAAALKPLSEIAEWRDKWSVDTLSPAVSVFPTLSKDLSSLGITALASLEAQTSLIAKDFGLSKITSVASQLSAITETLSSQTSHIRELIAPSSMLTDLETIATKTHKAIVDSGSLSAWQLGVVESASYLVDRQIDWTSQFCSSVYGEKPITQIDELRALSPKVNVISVLPLNLEEEKKKDGTISPKEAFEKTPSFRLTEKGKQLVNKIVDVNKMCERTGRKPIFKYTGGTTVAAATMGGTVGSTKEAFGNIIDSLYMFFYENLEHIKAVVSDDAVRNDDIYQCVFRVKDIRTDYRHDYEHGSENSIRKKNKSIGDSYTHYAGRPVLLTSADYQTAQDKLYDEFDHLADHLIEAVSVIH